MRTRTISLISLLALVVAACGGGAEDTTTSSSSPADTTSTTGPTAEAVVLSYSLQSGMTYGYEVDTDQTIELTSSGNTDALSEGDEEVPGEMSIRIQGTSVFTYAVADGPEPGTYEINITGDFSDLEFSGTVDGESVESTEIPDLAEMEPVDVTVVVDEKGNVIPDNSAGLGEGFLGGLGGFDMLDQFSAGGGTGQFIGPPLSEGEVAVGDTWSETVEVPTLPDADPIVTNIESEVVATDTVDGNEVFVIDTTSTTPAFEFDLAEFLIGFMTSFMPEDATDEERAELDAIVDELRFAFSLDETVTDMTTWFDFEAGVARQAEIAGDTHMVMDLNIPDETSGELVEFAVDMSLIQETSYRLTPSGSN